MPGVPVDSDARWRHGESRYSTRSRVWPAGLLRGQHQRHGERSPATRNNGIYFERFISCSGSMSVAKCVIHFRKFVSDIALAIVHGRCSHPSPPHRRFMTALTITTMANHRAPRNLLVAFLKPRDIHPDAGGGAVVQSISVYDGRRRQKTPGAVQSLKAYLNTMDEDGGCEHTDQIVSDFRGSLAPSASSLPRVRPT